MADFSGSRVLVTGGGVGIGAEIALAFARAGADVALTYRSHDGDAVAGQIVDLGRIGVAYELDATDSVAVDAVVEEAATALGGAIDVVVNNAGGLIGRVPIAEMSDAHWRTVIDVNLTSTFFVTRAALRFLTDGGRIVNLGSVAAQTGGSAGSAAYAAAKSALEGLSRGLAKELGPRGVTVNTVAPGFIADTPFHDTFSSREKQAATVAGTPLGRPGTTADVAAAVLYLASPGASFQTGTVVDVNGGTWFTG